MSLINMSLTGGVFILAVLLLRAVFQNIVPRRTFLVLWMAANALLLIPLRPRLPVSIYSLASRQTAPAQRAAVTAIQHSVRSGGLPWWQLLWAFGGVVLLAVVLIAHAGNLWRFRKAVPVEPHPADVPARVRVRKLPGLPSPLAFGVIRPTILIPSEDFATPEQLRHIYLHELCHIRHLDVLRRYLLLFALAVHWFNPLVWIMYYVASQDMEMRCDEQVIRQLGAKKPYAATLVAMETGKLQHLLDAGFSFSSTGSRLKAILKAKRLPVISMILGLVLFVSVLAVFGTDAAEIVPEKSEPAAVQTQTAPVSVPSPAPEPERTPEPEHAPKPDPAPVPEAETKPESEPESSPKDAASKPPETVHEEETAAATSTADVPPSAASAIPAAADAPEPPASDTPVYVPETDSQQAYAATLLPDSGTASPPDLQSEPEETAQADPDLDSYAASIEKWAQEQRDRQYQEQVDYLQKVQQAQSYVSASSQQPQTTPGWTSALPSGTGSFPKPMYAGNPYPPSVPGIP